MSLDVNGGEGGGLKKKRVLNREVSMNRVFRDKGRSKSAVAVSDAPTLNGGRKKEDTHTRGGGRTKVQDENAKEKGKEHTDMGVLLVADTPVKSRVKPPAKKSGKGVGDWGVRSQDVIPRPVFTGVKPVAGLGSKSGDAGVIALEREAGSTDEAEDELWGLPTIPAAIPRNFDSTPPTSSLGSPPHSPD